MPIYDFKCRDCGGVSELLLLSPSENRKPACQSCGSHDLERLVSAPNLLHNAANSGATCCGRAERCETPPCSTGGGCRRH